MELPPTSSSCLLPRSSLTSRYEIGSSWCHSCLHAVIQAASDLKSDLKDLNISAAKEIELDGGRKAIVIFVPFRQLKDFHKIQTRLVRELEKKFRYIYCWLTSIVVLILCSCVLSGRHVVVVAQRTILPKSVNRSAAQKAPRSRTRTLTAVHEAVLDVSAISLFRDCFAKHSHRISYIPPKL